MKPVLVFDIETIPDVDGLRRLHVLDRRCPTTRSPNSPSSSGGRRAARFPAVAPAARGGDLLRAARRQGFPRLVAGRARAGRSEIIQRFFDGVEKFTPQTVSWNGGGFDLPVLHYRGLIHGLVAPRYWDLGDGDYADSRDFKWNNYISRYHTRHLDLMDLLAMYQPRASVPLDELAKLIGFPGKLGMDGSKVWQAWQEPGASPRSATTAKPTPSTPISSRCAFA
jgi:predicted PolB exonuclease-like 3'-5' exonuclease